MLGKPFLLAVACVFFVQVRGDLPWLMPESSSEVATRDTTKETPRGFDPWIKVFLSNATAHNGMSNETLENAIKDAIATTNDIYNLGVRLLRREWNTWNDLRRIITWNATDYTNRNLQDRSREGQSYYNQRDESPPSNYFLLTKMAKITRDEAQNLRKAPVVLDCIDKVEETAKERVDNHGGQLSAQILRLTLEFNMTVPEFPFELVTEELQSMHSEKVEVIKGCKDTIAVEAELQDFSRRVKEMFNSSLKSTTDAENLFFDHQMTIYKMDRAAEKEREKIWADYFAELRNCLDTRVPPLGGLFSLNV